MKTIKNIVLLLCLTACSSFTHKTAKEVYQSGKFDKSNFKLIKEDLIASRNFYQYKYDTALTVRLSYYDKQRKHLAGYAYYYHGKAQGKWIFYTISGTLLGETSYVDGNKNGFDLTYDDKGSIISRTFYANGVMQYMIKYDSAGKIIDSTSR